MKPFEIITGVAAPLLIDDMNTDQIIPVHWVRQINGDLKQGLFGYLRQNGERDGEPFILDRPEYRNARILVAGENFGSGSSREHAVWAMQRFGIDCIVAKSFADQYRENCLKNGLLTVTLDASAMSDFVAEVVQTAGNEDFTVDLAAQTITGPIRRYDFQMEAFVKMALIEGLDDIGLTLKHEARIAAHERRMRDWWPYIQAMEIRQ